MVIVGGGYKGKVGGEVDKHRDKYHFQLQLRIFRLAISIIPPSPVKRCIKIQELWRLSHNYPTTNRNYTIV
jgi:hypothetical protein